MTDELIERELSHSVIGAFLDSGLKPIVEAFSAFGITETWASDVARAHIGESVRDFTSQHAPDLKISDKLAESLDGAGKVSAIVDFTHPKFAAHHALREEDPWRKTRAGIFFVARQRLQEAP